MRSITDAEVSCGNIYATFFLPWVSEKELELYGQKGINETSSSAFVVISEYVIDSLTHFL